MSISLLGEVRRFLPLALGGAPRALRMTGLESLSTAQTEPLRFELSRSGRRFIGGNQVIASGIAPVAAIPTTTATLALYNRDPTKVLVIEQLGLWLGSGTPAAGATLFATVAGPIASAPTAMLSGFSISSASGSGVASKALWAAAVTLPGAPSWFQVLSSFQLAAANVGQGDIVSNLDGAIVIPPLHALGLGILSGTGTTPLYGISCIHSEIEAQLE